MKIALISPYENIAAYGLRILSATLKQKGHQVGMFFISLPFELTYPEALLDELSQRLREYDAIGISLMSNYFSRALQLTESLHDQGHKNIIWGGIHPTVSPEESIQYADYLVIGEGENSLPELLDCLSTGGDLTSVHGIAYRGERPDEKYECRLTPSALLIEDLDTIPFPDYSYENHFIWNDMPVGIGGQGDRRGVMAEFNQLVKENPSKGWQPLTSEELVDNAGGDYLTLSSRGCPYPCTFCANCFQKKLYDGGKWYRKRSVENMLEELHYIKKNHPYFTRMYYDDDAFMHRPLAELQEFARRMKTEIKAQFVVTGVTPSSLTEEKLELLLDAGLKWIRIGIQSYSERVNREIYQRPIKTEAIHRAVEIVRKYQDRLETVFYDFIVDNPWETAEENLSTARFILDLPPKSVPFVYSLVFFPGAQLRQRALAEGIVAEDITPRYDKSPDEFSGESYTNSMYDYFQDPNTPIYRKANKSFNEVYAKNLFYLFALSNWPKWALKIFVNPLVIKTGLHRLLWFGYTSIWKLPYGEKL